MPCHLECVHQPSREVTFLDSRIKVDLERRRIITKVYDKRSEMNSYQNVRTFHGGHHYQHANTPCRSSSLA